MGIFRCVGLFALLCGVVIEAGKFENFIFNIEEITAINAECNKTVAEYKETLQEQKEINSNLTNKIVELEAKNEGLKLALTTMQGKLHSNKSFVVMIVYQTLVIS